VDDSLAIHNAFVRGDIESVRTLLGNPPDFPNTEGPDWLGNLLIYAIFWSPLETVRTLLALGIDATYEADDGFPPLIAVIDRNPRDGRDDRVAITRLLLEHGANPNLHGMNDGTALHQLVWKREAWPDHLEAARVLLEHGADPDLKTRIDDYASALEDAEALGATDLVRLLRGET
jgi:ankyrin repeat protein